MTNRIAELRKERKLSQAELAEAVDVTRQTIISLESGRYNASLLLAHRNTHFETDYAALGADLTLSGHGHGGLGQKLNRRALDPEQIKGRRRVHDHDCGRLRPLGTHRRHRTKQRPH